MKRILIGVLLLLILGIIILKVLSNSYNDLTRPDEPMGIENIENDAENETPYDIIESQDEEGNTIKKYILVVAIGKPKFVDETYVKEGAVVIDVGIHRNAENKLCGDVDFDRVAPHTSAITPVPGGVGPMTIAMLMNNCVSSVE